MPQAPTILPRPSRYLRSLALVVLLSLGPSLRAQIDIGSSLTFVGNPFLARFSAGTAVTEIHDLHPYSGHLWIANGSTGYGFSIDVWGLRLADQTLVRLIQNHPQEIVQEFKPFGPRLFLASDDETAGATMTVIDGTVVNTRLVRAPNNQNIGAHNRDLVASADGQTILYPLSTGDSSPAQILISGDGGASWRWATGVPANGTGPSRFLPFRGAVYAAALAGSFTWSTGTNFLHRHTPLATSDFAKIYENLQAAGLPSTGVPGNFTAQNAQREFANNLFIISGGRLWRFTQMEPQILYSEVSLLSNTPTFPTSAVSDLFLRGDTLYALTNEAVGTGTATRYRVTVHATTNGTAWQPLYRFTTGSANAVRAFARTSNAFYFGYSSPLDPTIANGAQSGAIYRFDLPSDGFSDLPDAPPLPPASPAPYVVDDFDLLRRVVFVGGTGTTATRADVDGDGDLELRVTRTDNSGLVTFITTAPPRHSEVISALRTGTGLGVRIRAAQGAAASNFTLRWAINTNAWTGWVTGNATQRSFASTSVNVSAATDRVFEVDLTANPEVAAAAANYANGQGTFFDLRLTNNGFPTFATGLDFALDDISIQRPVDVPAAPSGLSATLAGAGDRVNFTWTPRARATEGMWIERSTDGANFSTLTTAPTLAGATADPSPPLGATVTYRFRHYGQACSSASTLTVNTPTAYAVWRAGRFTASELADSARESDLWGPDADPDGDGLPNLLEYAIDSDPRAPSPGAGPSASLDSAGVLQLSFRRTRADLTYLVQGSANLSNWTTVSTNPGAVGEIVTVKDNEPGPRRFLRLRVSH